MSMVDRQTRQELAHLGLPQPDQIGFVVRDIDEAIALYDPMFGPCGKTDFGPQMASYRGAPPSPYKLHFAFGRIGDLEIELIEWVSGDTPHRDFIERGRDGMHHLRFRIDDLDAWAAKLKTIGYEVVWQENITPEIGFAYCERPGDPLLIELLKYPAKGDPTAPLAD